MRDTIHFFLNGQPVSVSGAAACGMLASYLRHERSLTGTKIACAQGACGSCSILLGRPQNDRFEYATINSCIFPVFNCDGCHVVTIEGVSGMAPEAVTLSAVQQAMVNCHAAQCGFCTPGIVIALTALHERGDSMTNDSVQSALEGNLCRCTGYTAIIDAGLQCQAANRPSLAEIYPAAALLDGLQVGAADSFELRGSAGAAISRVFSPRTLNEALRWKAENPDAVVIAGGTEIGVAINTEDYRPQAVLSLARIEEINAISIEDGTLVLGAGAHWSEVAEFAATNLPEFAGLLARWGSPQLRQAGTVAGNIVRAAPISDSLPFLLVYEAELEFAASSGVRRGALADFLRDRLHRGNSDAETESCDLRPDELLTRVLVPLTPPGRMLRLYKVSKRRAFDRSIVSAAFVLEQSEGQIESIRIAYGGAAPSALRLKETEAFLQGKAVTASSWSEAGQIALGEITPVSTATAGSEYKRQLVVNLLRKFGREAAGAALPSEARKEH